ncbi:MAG TPA: rhomboid family intramembrane serine protease [Thermotogota bacterium]|nr:rhomboid family intramembrane serine protease [Thermotogota bacterium]HRW91520.1 rhomboid family intramembrane serine protease [Thermotogota bacterium]
MFPLKDTIPALRRPYVTWTLIGVNVLIFVVEWLLLRLDYQLGIQQISGLDAFVFQYGFTPARMTSAQYQEAFAKFFPGSPWVVVSWFSSLFLHGGWLHLLTNMWALWIFGDNVEDRMGHGYFLVFYVLSGLAGNLMHFMSGPFSKIPLVGASGAIAGVMGAYLVLFPHSKILTLFILIIFPYFVAIPAPLYLGFWFALQFFNGATSFLSQNSDSVAYWAHIGGFLFGLLSFRWFLKSPAYGFRKEAP